LNIPTHIASRKQYEWREVIDDVFSMLNVNAGNGGFEALGRRCC